MADDNDTYASDDDWGDGITSENTSGNTSENLEELVKTVQSVVFSSKNQKNNAPDQAIISADVHKFVLDLLKEIGIGASFNKNNILFIKNTGSDLEKAFRLQKFLMDQGIGPNINIQKINELMGNRDNLKKFKENYTKALLGEDEKDYTVESGDLESNSSSKVNTTEDKNSTQSVMSNTPNARNKEQNSLDPALRTAMQKRRVDIDDNDDNDDNEYQYWYGDNQNNNQNPSKSNKAEKNTPGKINMTSFNEGSVGQLFGNRAKDNQNKNSDVSQGEQTIPPKIEQNVKANNEQFSVPPLSGEKNMSDHESTQSSPQNTSEDSNVKNLGNLDANNKIKEANEKQAEETEEANKKQANDEKLKRERNLAAASGAATLDTGKNKDTKLTSKEKNPSKLEKLSDFFYEESKKCSSELDGLIEQLFLNLLGAITGVTAKPVAATEKTIKKTLASGAEKVSKGAEKASSFLKTPNNNLKEETILVNKGVSADPENKKDNVLSEKENLDIDQIDQKKEVLLSTRMKEARDKVIQLIEQEKKEIQDKENNATDSEERKSLQKKLEDLEKKSEEINKNYEEFDARIKVYDKVKRVRESSNNSSMPIKSPDLTTPQKEASIGGLGITLKRNVTELKRTMKATTGAAEETPQKTTKETNDGVQDLKSSPSLIISTKSKSNSTYDKNFSVGNVPKLQEEHVQAYKENYKNNFYGMLAETINNRAKEPINISVMGINHKIASIHKTRTKNIADAAQFAEHGARSELATAMMSIQKFEKTLNDIDKKMSIAVNKIIEDNQKLDDKEKKEIPALKSITEFKNSEDGKKSLKAYIKEIKLPLSDTDIDKIWDDRKQFEKHKPNVIEARAKVEIAKGIKDMFRSIEALSENRSRYTVQNYERRVGELEALMDKHGISENEKNKLKEAIDQAQKDFNFKKRKFHQTRFGGSTQFDSTEGQLSIGDKYRKKLKIEHTTEPDGSKLVSCTFTFNRAHLSGHYESKFSPLHSRSHDEMKKQVGQSLDIAIKEYDKGSPSNPINVRYGKTRFGKEIKQPDIALGIMMDLKQRAILEGREFSVVHPKTKEIIKIGPTKELSADEKSIMMHYAKEKATIRSGLLRSFSESTYGGTGILRHAGKDSLKDFKSLKTSENVDENAKNDEYISLALQGYLNNQLAATNKKMNKSFDAEVSRLKADSLKKDAKNEGNIKLK